MAQLEQARKEAREKLEQAEADYAEAMAPQIEALQDQVRRLCPLQLSSFSVQSPPFFAMH